MTDATNNKNDNKPLMGRGVGHKGHIQLPREIAQTLGLSAAAVYGAVWYFSRLKDHICKAEVETIADWACVSTRTAGGCLKELAKHHYITDLDDVKGKPPLRNRPHRYVCGDLEAMKNAENSDVKETLLPPEEDSYSANIADLKKSYSANIADQNENGQQNMSIRSVNNANEQAGEDTFFADEREEKLKEINTLIEKFPFLLNLENPEISESLSSKEQAIKYFDYAKTKMDQFNVPLAHFDTWIKPCTVVSFEADKRLLLLGLSNSYAKEKFEKDYLILFQAVLERVWFENISIEVQVYHSDYIGLLREK